jgi:DnaJ-class molecular chaperone
MLIDHYYFKLGLSPGEPAERIRQVFREQVNLYHPERLGSTRLRFFEELVRAYHALSNPERRPEYDHARSDTEPGRYAKPAHVGPVAGGLRGLPRISPTLPVRVIFSASFFEVALARASRNLVTGTIDEAISPEGLDLQVVISPAAALAGGVLKLDVPSCSPCSQCGGAGRQGRFPCEVCDGEGLLRHIEEVRVTVPENAGDLTRIKVPLRGLGPHNFYLSVRIRIAGQIEEIEPKYFGT